MSIKVIEWVRHIERYRKALNMIEDEIKRHDGEIIRLESTLIHAPFQTEIDRAVDFSIIYHMNARNELYNIKQRMIYELGK